MRNFLLSAAIAACVFTVSANEEVRWHSEATDTIRITNILKDVEGRRFASPSERTGYIGRKFVGTPYVAHTLEGSPEMLTVNIDELDCTTFVETALALSFTASEGRNGWQDFLYNLRRIRYRGGEVNGYASRLHYNCDWIIDNTHRGNIQEITTDFPFCKYIVRSIEFMSDNADKYPALADEAELERIRNVELGFRNHRFPYIKTSDLANRDFVKNLRDGDILCFVSTLKNLDVTHMGMIVIEDDIPYVLHASSSNGKVEISQLPLSDFVKKNRFWTGVRILRLAQ